MSQVTNASLLAYYKRWNDKELTRYFSAEILLGSMQSLGLIDSMRTIVILKVRCLFIWVEKLCE